jgi:hypothetical protein
MESTDLKKWTPLKDLVFPPGVRHGTAFAVPAAIAARLMAHTDASGRNH